MNRKIAARRIFRQLPQVPQTRGECESAPRPCPHTTCRHHMALDVVLDCHGNETIVETRDWHWGKATCSLDLADAGPMLPEAIASELGLTRQRVQAIIASAIQKARKG